MSYSVNFSEDPKTPGKIVLDNVVMNGAKYAPSAVTEVFTKDATGLLSKQPIDLTKIQYAPAGAGVPVPPGEPTVEPTVEPDVVSKVATEGAVPGAPVPKVETEGVPVPTLGEIETGAAIKETTPERNFIIPKKDGPNTLEKELNKPPTPFSLLQKEIQGIIKTENKGLKTVPPKNVNAIVSEGEPIGENVFGSMAAKAALLSDPDNPPPPIKPVTTDGADSPSIPLVTPAATGSTGGASRKTKRNRRKNKRFVKKSYKRRR